MGRSVFRLLVSSALFLVAFPATAVQRAFVSAITGDDANTATNCSVTAPCRTFAGGILVVDPDGELLAMDSGAYGPVTVTKSITIMSAPGVYAGMTVFSGNGVTIATPNVRVILRGLTINGLGGANGISMTDGESLSVENCVIANFTSDGVSVVTPAKVSVTGTVVRKTRYALALSNGASASVSDSNFYNNYIAVRVFGGSTPTVASVHRSVAAHGSMGFESVAPTGSFARLTVSDSAALSNSWMGIRSSATPAGWGGDSQVTVSNTRVHLNNTGLESYGPGSKIIITGNTVTNSSFMGVNANSGGAIESTGDNVVRANGPYDVGGTISAIPRI